MPRLVLAEFNTHRAFSRNSASSRAIPVERQLAKVREDPFIPVRFPVNKPGMSADDYVSPGEDGYDSLVGAWLEARDHAVDSAENLMRAGVHKQVANRLLEPFMWHTVIVSATEWDNFFTLRISEFAQPEIRAAAEAMRDAMAQSTPASVSWHLPLVDDDDLTLEQKIKCSVARCAAVSYDRHLERDIDKELKRYDLLASNGHLSPFEHVAYPTRGADKGNFRGWRQVRWFIERGSEPPFALWG